MVLTIDIGNTNIVLGVFEDDNLRFISRLSTQAGMQTADEVAIKIKAIFEIRKIDCSIIDFSHLFPPSHRFQQHNDQVAQYTSLQLLWLIILLIYCSSPLFHKFL